MELLNSFFALKKKYHANLSLIITDNTGLAKKVLKNDSNAVFITYNVKLYKFLRKKKVIVKKLNSVLAGVNILSQIKYLLLLSSAEGIIKKEDKVLCLVSDSIVAIVFFDVKDIELSNLKEVLGKEIDINIVEKTLNISFEIMKEGKEGKPHGALFVLGDAENVMKHSQQLIINPLKGHSSKKRNILNEKNFETIKNFAQLDGATIINEKGEVVACGRYLNIYGNVEQSGLGCRHLAGISISKTTDAIAIVVSSSKVVRVFKDGEEIFKIRGI